MGGKNYKDLIVWQKAIDLAEAVYAVTKAFPREEQYGLTVQMRRAAISIPCNIAEGQGRRSGREFRHFLSISYGSLRELETQVVLASRFGYLQEGENADLTNRSAEVGRLLNGLSRTIVD